MTPETDPVDEDLVLLLGAIEYELAQTEALLADMKARVADRAVPESYGMRPPNGAVNPVDAKRVLGALAVRRQGLEADRVKLLANFPGFPQISASGGDTISAE